MVHVIEAGVMRGRPFGGVAAFIKDSFRIITVTVVTEDRFVLLRSMILYYEMLICIVLVYPTVIQCAFLFYLTFGYTENFI